MTEVRRHLTGVPLPASPSILIIRPSALGDVCRSVPLAVSMRAAFPESRISWLVQESFAPAVIDHPAVDEVVPFPRARLRRWWTPNGALDAIAWLRGLRSLPTSESSTGRRDRFGLVLDAQGLGRSGLMTFATGARRRIGFSDAREFGWLGCNERYRVNEVHTVDRMLALLDRAGIPPKPDLRLHCSIADETWWVAERARRGIDRYAVIAPTSRWPTKDWPAEHWRHLTQALIERGFTTVIAIGTSSERGRVAAALPDGAPAVVNLAGVTSVGQSMAVIAESALVIANDSAPLHIAVGFDRPLLALFGPTDPARVGPYGRDACVLRSDEAKRFRGSYRDARIGDRLMRGLTVAEVTRALDADVPQRGRVGALR